MMNDEITLIEVIKGENEIGDPIETEERTTVLCEIESVTRNEFYQAAHYDMNPEIVFVINKYDYNNQTMVEFEGSLYDVIRSYEPRQRHNPTPMYIDRLELVCKGVD